jgi:hypothetical protein
LREATARRVQAEKDEAAYRKSVEGLEDGFPELRPIGPERMAALVEKADDQTNQTVGQAIREVFDRHPGEWLTVKLLIGYMPMALRNRLKDPEAAVRAALGRMEDDLDKKPWDGRTLAYQRHPLRSGVDQPRLEGGG